MREEIGRQFKKDLKGEKAALVWQCVNTIGHRCEGHSNDSRVDCSLCQNFPEGIERRKKARAEEEKNIFLQTVTETDEELSLIDRGNYYSLVIGKRIKDDSNPDIFKVKKSLNLTFNDINNISAFLQLAGLVILDKKLPFKNR